MTFLRGHFLLELYTFCAKVHEMKARYGCRVNPLACITSKRKERILMQLNIRVRTRYCEEYPVGTYLEICEHLL